MLFSFRLELFTTLYEGGDNGGCFATVRLDSFSWSVPLANVAGYPPAKALVMFIFIGGFTLSVK